jgi:hypothetical protein
MKHETTTALYEYWLSCHRGSTVRAATMRAGDLAPILPSLFLIDIDSRRDAPFPFRFCGASIATRYGRDLSDESFLELWNATDATTLRRDLGAHAFRSTGMVTGVMAETVGGGFVSYEMLFLPLAGESATVGAIGSMVRVGGHDESNRIKARIVEQTLRSIRFLPDARRLIAPPRPASALVANAASLGMPRRYGHLTVVSGGK